MKIAAAAPASMAGVAHRARYAARSGAEGEMLLMRR